MLAVVLYGRGLCCNSVDELTNDLNGVEIKLHFHQLYKLGWLLDRARQLQLLFVREATPFLAKLFGSDLQRPVGSVTKRSTYSTGQQSVDPCSHECPFATCK